VGLDLSGDAAALGSTPVGPGTVLLAQNHDDHWSATSGRPLAHRVAFGWGNAFEQAGKGVVSVGYDGQTPATLLVIGQGLVWLAVLVVAWRGRRRWITRLVPADPTTRVERREDTRRRREARAVARDRLRRDELDDDFWSHG